MPLGGMWLLAVVVVVVCCFEPPQFFCKHGVHIGGGCVRVDVENVSNGGSCLSRDQTSRKKLIPFRSSSREVWNITLGVCMKTATF